MPLQIFIFSHFQRELLLDEVRPTHVHWLHDYILWQNLGWGSAVQLTSFLTYLRSSCGRDFDDNCLLRCVAMQYGRCLLACQRSVLPSSSRYSSIMKMEAVHPSETVINIFQITSHPRSNPSNHELHPVSKYPYPILTDSWFFLRCQ